MKINVKLIDNGKLPEIKTKDAACFDCYANEDVTIKPFGTQKIKLGFAIEVPSGFYAEMRGRSGLSCKGIMVMTGTIDADYRGEVAAIVANFNNSEFTVKKGERISQMQIKRVIDVELVTTTELSDTKRGSNGFGSTGIL